MTTRVAAVGEEPADPSRSEGYGSQQPASTAPAERAASWHVLAQPTFRAYFACSLLSNIGTWLQTTAQMLLAYRLSHSALTVGVVSSAQFCGFLFLGPWVAAKTTRLDSRRVLISSQLASAGVAAVMAALYFSGTLSVTGLIVGALALGVAFAFATPMQAALVSRLVRPKDTKAAMAMNSVSYNAGRTLAPVLAVVVVVSVGAGGAFALNAVSFGIFALAILFLRPAQPDRAARADLSVSGLRMVIQRPRILLLLAMVAAITWAEDPILVLGPTLAHQVLGVSSSWPAFFLSALGAGTVLGSAIPTKPARSRGVAFSLLILALAMLLFVNSTSPIVALISATVAGAAGLLTGAAAQTLLLSTAGPAHAAQVMALWAVAWAGTKPVASLLDGWLGSQVGLSWAGLALIGPALCIAVAELAMPTRGRSWFKFKARAYAFSKI